MGPADVDVFQGFFQGYTGPADGINEGIQIAGDQVDGCDVVFLKLGQVVREVAPGKDAAVDDRMQGLDPAVEDFRGAGDLRHLADGQSAVVGEGVEGAAGADEFISGLIQPAAEFDHSGLVVYAD